MMTHWCRRYVVPFLLGIITLIPFVLLIGAIRYRFWDAATTNATLIVGFIAADVVDPDGALRNPSSLRRARSKFTGFSGFRRYDASMTARPVRSTNTVVP